MDHVAIDLGSRKSQVCVRISDGKIIEEKRLETSRLKEYLVKKAKSRVVVETCAEAFGAADNALAMGHEERVVPAFQRAWFGHSELGPGGRRPTNGTPKC